MHEIKSFKVWQTAKILAVLGAIYAEIEAIFLVLISFKAHNLHNLRQAIAAIVGIPIMAAFLGFLFTALLCWLYNQVAPRLGGITFELTPRSEN
jgi:hypothetical protein